MRCIACFQGRHRDCPGTCKPFFPDDCHCECREQQPSGQPKGDGT